MNEIKNLDFEGFHPSQFMRARRPELFSDSKLVGEAQLAPEVFEYHLDTLTRRKQEIEFEHFCRRLAEKEICPNLLPQTGPTGGGDSKVDAETYPVADQVALRWYEGIGQQSSQERWAFAFSAKKEWRSKVRSDVKKIVDTKRDYKVIYFITNQFVKDKTRAEIEDELSKKYALNVRILDRTWIIKCIFEHNRLQLAIETLSLTAYEKISQKLTGPRDTEREAALQELEQQINEVNRYKGVEYQLAEDCLQAALLARELELPRVEVEGRFLRAERIAEKVNHQQQLLRIVYARAWTAFWWYEDFEELNSLYDRVEDLATGSEQATDVELLSNLWPLIHTTVKWGKLSTEAARLDARTVKLRGELERIAADKQRPNNALLARTKGLFIDLIIENGKGAPPNKALLSLKKALLASKGLAEFPLLSITQILQEIGEFLTDNTEYDDLFEVIVSLTEQRASKGQAGLVLLERGYQKLKAGKKYDAIRLLGRAQQKLAMSEYEEEWGTSIVFCGLAYEAAGLMWAARANILMAANQALSQYVKHGRLVPQTLRYLQKLVWLELQLGRVFHVLAWVELASLIAHQLQLEDDQKEMFFKERETQDIILGILLLKTDIWELKWLDFLPRILEKFRLDFSWMALLFALGHEDHLRKEEVFSESESSEAIRDFFGKWLEQPAAEEIPDQPELNRSEKVTLRSFVLGCEVIVEVANNPTSLYLAETILGALEGFLATSLGLKGELIPYKSELRIYIRSSDFIGGLPEYQINDADEAINIRDAPNYRTDVSEGQKSFYSWLMDFVLETTFLIAMANDPKSFVKKIVRDEQGLGRALNFSDVSRYVENMLGKTPRFRLSDWEAQAGPEKFILRRTIPWNYGLKQTDIKQEKKETSWIPGIGEPPEELFGIDNLKHKDQRICSLIDLPLWNKAGWQAALYIYPPDSIPMLALGFTNPEAGKRIFEGWHNKIGQVDEEEKLRVSIITGIDKKHPSSYKVVISTNLESARESNGNHFLIVSRIHRMDPPNLQNLNNFIQQYEREGRYVILPTHFVDFSTINEPLWRLGIVKQELQIRQAWQIGEHDPDVCSIEENDDPIIPDDVKDAPVIRALKRFSNRKKPLKRKRQSTKKKR